MTGAVVKSASRTLALLEYLGEVRGPVSMSEVSQALSLPLSSTSVLLKSLLTLGYLAYDRQTRRYRATYRVALIGEWLQRTMLDNARLTDLVAAISRETGDTVLVAQQVGAMVQYLHVVPSIYPVRLHIPVGTLRPMAVTATGAMLMSQMSDNEVRGIIRRNNAERKEGAPPIVEADLLRTTADARRDGYARSFGQMTHGASVVAMLLGTPPGDPALAIGVGGPIARIDSNLDRIVAVMRDCLSANGGTRGRRGV